MLGSSQATNSRVTKREKVSFYTTLQEVQRLGTRLALFLTSVLGVAKKKRPSFYTSTVSVVSCAQVSVVSRGHGVTVNTSLVVGMMRRNRACDRSLIVLMRGGLGCHTGLQQRLSTLPPSLWVTLLTAVACICRHVQTTLDFLACPLR